MSNVLVFGVNGHLLLRNPKNGAYEFDRAGYTDAAGETVRPVQYRCPVTGQTSIAYKYDKPAMDGSLSERFLVASAYTDRKSGKKLVGWVKTHVNPAHSHGATIAAAIPTEPTFHLGDADTFHVVNTHPLAENMLEESYHQAKRVGEQLFARCNALGESHVLCGDARRHYKHVHSNVVPQEALPSGFTLDIASSLQGPVYAVPVDRMDKIAFQAIGVPRRRPTVRVTVSPSNPSAAARGAAKARTKAAIVTSKPSTPAPKPPPLPPRKPVSDAEEEMRKRTESTLKARTGSSPTEPASSTGTPQVKPQGPPKPKSASKKALSSARKTARKALKSPEGKALTGLGKTLAVTATEAAAAAAATAATQALVDALSGIGRKKPSRTRRVDTIPAGDEDGEFVDDEDEVEFDDDGFPASKIGEENTDEDLFLLEEGEATVPQAPVEDATAGTAASPEQNGDDEDDEELGVEDLDTFENGEESTGYLVRDADGFYRIPRDVTGDGRIDYQDAFNEGYGKTEGGNFTVVSVTDPDGDGFLQDRDYDGNELDTDVLGSDGSQWEAIAAVGDAVEGSGGGGAQMPAWRMLYGPGVDPVDGDGTLDNGMEEYADPNPNAQTTFAILDADGDGVPGDEDSKYSDGYEYQTDIVDNLGQRWEAVRYVGDSVDGEEAEGNKEQKRVVVKRKNTFVIKYCPTPDQLSKRVVVYKARAPTRGPRIVRIGQQQDDGDEDDEDGSSIPSALGPGSVPAVDGASGMTIQLLNQPRGPPPYLIYCRDSKGRPTSCSPYFPLASEINGAESVSHEKQAKIAHDLRAAVKRNVLWLVKQHPKA